jgi:hypothetical protein
MSTVGAAAYINRMDLHQEGDRFLEADNHKFSDRGEEHVIAQGILAPDHAPEYLKNADPRDKQLYRQTTERLWNDAEHAGHKSNAITGREWMLPIPSELNKQEAQHLVRAFVSDYLVEKGMVAQYAIHEPNEKNDERNLHAHVLTTDRDITPEGFAAKKTASLQWHHRDLVREAHSEWAKACNNALALSQHRDVHIDNRRNSVQLADALEHGDIDRALELSHVPGFHRGRAIKEMESRGIESYKAKDRETLAADRWEHETGELSRNVEKIMSTHREIQATLDEQIELVGREMKHELGRGAERGKGAHGIGKDQERTQGRTRGATREHGSQDQKRDRGHDRGPEIGF